MTLLAKAMLVVFIAAWFIGVAAWFYGTRFFLPMWATGFRKTDKRKAYIRKALKGYGVFLLAVGFCFTAGGIAEYWVVDGSLFSIWNQCIGLKSFMLLSSIINLSLFALLAILAVQNIEGPFPRAFLFIVPLVIAGFQFSAVLPRARALRPDERTSYWAYRDANIPTLMLLVIVTLSGVPLIFQ